MSPSSATHFLFHDEENLNTIKRKLENQRGGYLNFKKRLFAKQIYKDKRSFTERDVRPDPSFRGHSGILGAPLKGRCLTKIKRVWLVIFTPKFKAIFITKIDAFGRSFGRPQKSAVS